MLNLYKKAIAAAAVLAAIVIAVYCNIKPTATKEDITLEAALRINDTTNNEDKEYLVDIDIIQNKESHVIIYPYIKGLGTMAFSTGEKEGYFVPGSVGSDGVTEAIAITELKNKKLIDSVNDVSLIGFGFPEEVGQYKARVYLDKLDSFKGIENPVLICVYKEEKYGKELTWSKVIPITIK